MTQKNDFVKIIILFIFFLFPCKIFSADETVWLSSLNFDKAMYAGGKKLGIDKNINGDKIKIGGKKFDKGVCVNAHSIFYIDLKGSASRFRAVVGVDDAVIDKDIKISFRVLDDKKELWNSGILNAGKEGKTIDLDIKGINNLALISRVYDGNNCQYAYNLADWADAKFITAGDLPELVTPPEEESYILTPKPPKNPRINGPAIYGARPNSPFLYKIPVTGVRPLKFSVKNLPEGLRLDREKGIITGSVSQRGKYTVTLEAENSKGKDKKDFVIKIGDKLALTPPMGWNDWYSYTMSVTDKTIRESADQMISSGMADYGYSYINIDDCWMVVPSKDYPLLEDCSKITDCERFSNSAYLKYVRQNSTNSEIAGIPRDEAGYILSNSHFPDMSALTDYIHSKGLKAGIYSTPGPLTCAGYVGSYLHEEKDAKQIAKWGFDFFKYDWCSYRYIAQDQSRKELVKPYDTMNAWLKKQPRDIVFNFCQYGKGNVWEWAEKAGGNCWRTTLDFGALMTPYCLYTNLVTLGFAHNGLEKWAGPGHWNDPDYILIGYKAEDKGRFMLSPSEQYSYMTLWCLLSAPLIYSGNMNKLDEFTLNILCNNEVIQVDQDPLGQQAKRIYQDDDTEIWAKNMADGSIAVGLFNVGEWEQQVTFKWDYLNLDGSYNVRDLWRQKDLGTFSNDFTMSILRHGAGLIRLVP